MSDELSSDDKLMNYFNQDRLSCDAWLGKYAQKGEITPDDMHKRLAKEFARIDENWQKKEKNFEKGISEYGFIRNSLGETSIYEFLEDFKYIIPQGSVMSQLGSESIGSLSNCFVIGQPVDSYGGILQKDQEMAQLMKRRGGVGTDLSTLRPSKTNTSNAAKTSTGPVSFMPRYSNTTREVAQDGRRGALMISMDIRHPDSLKFITVKRDLSQITGANISVKLNNEFMKAVENDEDYILRFPCNVEISKDFWSPDNNNLLTDGNGFFWRKIKAKEYWDEIIKSAHSVAEPGIIFEDNHHSYSPDGVYPQYRGVTTNPCGEIFMQPYDACRLIVVNLFSFVVNPFTEKAVFNFEKFYRINYEAMRLSDNLVDLELEHIERIIDKIDSDPEDVEVKRTEKELWKKIYTTASNSRRTGLGFTALADCLAALGLKYDSDEALKITEQIMYHKVESELDCTIDLAILRGTFEGWDKHKEFEKEDFGGSYNLHGNNDFYNFIVRNFPNQAERMFKFGRRNVSFSTVAPAGTTSLMTQTSSGIEPIFLPFYIRRKKVNPNDKDVRVDFTDQNGDTWQEYTVLHPKFKDWIEINYIDVIDNQPTDVTKISKERLQELFEESPWYGSTANDIDWIKRVELQAIIQKYISHSISSTINLPNEVTEEEVSQIYLESWKKGLKGITVYRDGSRSGVLVSNSITENKFQYKDIAVKRPKSLPCKIHQSTTKGEHFLIIVGLIDDKPYEVFCIPNEYNLPAGILEGNMIKIQKGIYNLDIKDVMLIHNATHTMTPIEQAITRLTSTSLRHGADIKFIVEQLNKSDESDMFSFTRSLARILKKYIPDGAKSTITCNDCESNNVIFEEGCSKCLDCGSSKCG